jgi:hypothetical protein
MPLPEPKELTLSEAAQYVARHCGVDENAARERVERAMKESLPADGVAPGGRRQSLGSQSVSVFDAGGKIDWDKSIVRWRSPGGVGWRELSDVRISRGALDQLIGYHIVYAATSANAEREVIEPPAPVGAGAPTKPKPRANNDKEAQIETYRKVLAAVQAKWPKKPVHLTRNQAAKILADPLKTPELKGIGIGVHMIKKLISEKGYWRAVEAGIAPAWSALPKRADNIVRLDKR